MTEVMMEKERSEATPAVPDEFDAVDEQLVEQLTDRARSQGLELTGEGGQLARLTKRVVGSGNTTQIPTIIKSSQQCLRTHSPGCRGRCPRRGSDRARTLTRVDRAPLVSHGRAHRGRVRDEQSATNRPSSVHN